MKTILTVLILVAGIIQGKAADITELCNSLQKKLEASSHNQVPTKITCDKYGNIEFFMNNPNSSNEKLVFNLFNVKTKIENVEFVGGKAGFKSTINCQTQCISLLNWGKVGNNLQKNEWEWWTFFNKEDADYVIKCLDSIKSKCTKAPLTNK